MAGLPAISSRCFVRWIALIGFTVLLKESIITCFVSPSSIPSKRWHRASSASSSIAVEPSSSAPGRDFCSLLRKSRDRVISRSNDGDLPRSRRRPIVGNFRRPAVRALLAAVVVLTNAVFARPAIAAAAAAASLPVKLGWKNLVAAASLVAVTGGIGLSLSGVPGLARNILQACLRSTLQLYLIGGFVLSNFLIVANTRPWMVWSWSLLTGILAAQEASARVEYTYPRLKRHLTLSILAGGGTMIAATLCFQILGKIEPWFSPRTWVPVSGMIFGNSLTATTLAATTITKELAVNRAQVELRLSHGATWKEALSSVLHTIYTTSLAPVITFLSVAGLVHMPGMMTGQILAGQAPFQAAAYQIVIFFLIAATACMTVQVLTRMAIDHLVDKGDDRLQLAKLMKVGASTQKRERFLLNDFLAVPQLCSAVKSYVSSLLRNRSETIPAAINGESIKQLPVQTVKLLRCDDSIFEKLPTLSIQNMKVPRMNMDVTLDLRYDDRIALQGRSGVGKSQVLRTIAGLEEVDRQALKLFDISANSMSMSGWRSHVALVPQDRPFLEGTPNQFYKQVSDYQSQRTKDSLEKNVIAGHRRTPAEYAADWGLDIKTFDQPWATLSGGESQRAMLAISLALQPDVLLLDETTSALDENTTLQVEATLKKLRIPIIMVSHSEKQVERFCNQRISLDRAKRQSVVGSSGPGS